MFNKFKDIIQDITNSNEVIISSVINLNFSNSIICDTISNYGTVYLNLPDKLNTIVKENVVINKKINKIMEKIDKMQKTMNEESYKQKAPQHVQISHIKQVSKLLMI